MRTLLLIFLSIGPILAQVDTGTLVGTVRDSTNATIPSASVTATEVNTNAKTRMQTDLDGNYASPPLKVGTYAVVAEVKGFMSQTRTSVVLQVQDRIRVDFQMQVGTVSENVTVDAQVPVIQTETSSLGQVVSSRQMIDLPLNGRNYLDLALLTSGVVSLVATNGNAGGTFATDGTRGDGNNFLLDGIDNNSNDDASSVVRPSVDAIQEFKIQTNSYSAEFGRSGGAVINAVIKSGSNQVHGSAFEFFRNSELDARDYFEDPTQKKASFKQNQFGGTIGGPLKRDKLFFFGDYQGTRIRQPETYISSVPTAAQRMGNFSGPGNDVVYDPNTYDLATNTRQPFPGNIISDDRIVGLSQNFMNLYPEPNVPGALKNNYVVSPEDIDGIDQMDARVDYNVRNADQIFARFSWSDLDNLQPTPLPGLANGGHATTTGLDFEARKGAALGNTHTFTPRTVNELRAGFSLAQLKRGVPIGGAQAPPADLQVPGVANNPATNGLTLFAPSGYTRVGDPTYAPNLGRTRETQASDTLSLIRGRNTIKVGGLVRYSEFNIFVESAPRGVFDFAGLFSNNPASPSGTGSSLADMLLGLPNLSAISSLMPTMGNRQHVYGGFIQDDFRVTSSLTLNLGLRYEYVSPIVEVHNNQSNFDYSTGQIVVAGQDGASRSLTNVDKLNFAPRIGLAWSPFPDHKTVFRTAYGIFYFGQEIRTAAPLQLAYNVPFSYEPTFISNGISPILTVAGGFPALNPSEAIDPPVTSEDSRLKTPYYQHWNFSIARQLPSQIGLEIAYAGSKGTHLQSVTDQNQVMVPGPADVQASRPYPNFGSFTAIQNRGNSTYDSLQFKAEKRFSRGLSFLSAFTRAKAIDDLPEICCASPFPQNSYDLAAEKGLSDFDERFRWVTSFDYELPFGKGKTFFNASRRTDLLIGGWHLGGILTFGSGFPFTPYISYDSSNTGSQAEVRTNRIANGNLPASQRSPDYWFDINAFPIPAQYTFGNAGRNILIGPGTEVANLSLRKIFSVSERIKLEFRAEFFDAFNHPNFNQPDSEIDDGPGAAGVITSLASPMREIQFGLRIAF
jgi:hypothetical protein